MTPIPTTTKPSLSPATATRRFNWLMTLLSLWLISGLHLDAWAHHQFEVETFFTPWHAILYSGFAATAVALIGTIFWNYRQTGVRQIKNWQTAVPTGYQLALLGVVLFLVGGVGDTVWHLLFGIEENLEALLSPTHLLLGLGGGLIITAPLRAAWQQTKAAPTLTTLLPALISLALTLSLFSFFTAYAHPLAETAVSGTPPLNVEQQGFLQAQGIASILLQTIIMMGLLLTIMRRWTLPFGSLTIVLTLATLLTVAVHEDFYLLVIPFVTGIVADSFYRWFSPIMIRPIHFRQLAFLLPALFYATYFTVLALTSGLWWTVHLWAGAIVLAGIAGWLLSYAIIPAGAKLAS